MSKNGFKKSRRDKIKKEKFDKRARRRQANREKKKAVILET